MPLAVRSRGALTTLALMPRLRRVRPTDPGWTRTGRGDDVRYLDESGDEITAPALVARIRDLAIPPAWRDVWICPRENGHLQATGLDDAGRRQYLYHPQWRARRDRAKHDHVLEVAARLPAARRRVRQDLLQPGLPRTKVLALAFRLLDLAYFRAGGEGYATAHGSYGLATLRREHVRLVPGGVRFRYPAKSGQLRDVVVDDPGVRELVGRLRRRPGGGAELLAYREGRAWQDVTSADVAGYVKELLGEDATVKDFRTWHATVLAAQGLGRAGAPPAAERARRRVLTGVVREVADELGNTPAVCRASYVDPRLLELWERGAPMPDTRSERVAEETVLALLGPQGEAAAA